MNPPASEEIVARWHVHLASQHPRQAWSAVGIVVAATGLALWATRSPLMTLVCGVVLFSAIADFLLPMTFTLTRSGATMRGWFKEQRIEWKDVRAFHEDARGVKLSPFAHPSRLEAYRGVYLWFNGNREQVMEWVKTLATNVEIIRGEKR
jgi:hypothetical protein